MSASRGTCTLWQTDTVGEVRKREDGSVRTPRTHLPRYEVGDSLYELRVPGTAPLCSLTLFESNVLCRILSALRHALDRKWNQVTGAALPVLCHASPHGKSFSIKGSLPSSDAPPNHSNGEVPTLLVPAHGSPQAASIARVNLCLLSDLH